MRGVRLDRPPLWGTLTLLLMVVANVAIFASMATRVAPGDDYTPRASMTGASETTASPATPAGATTPVNAPVGLPAPSLVVYGDGYSAGNDLGGRGAAGWPALVAERTGAELVMAAVPQAGYASLGTTGENFLDLVRRRPATDATVTVLFGSRNDADQDVGLVQSNAGQAISQVREDAPDTALIVVGPAWSDADTPPSLLALRDAVRAAAEAGGATFVDPLADGWFAQRPELIAGDGVSPTDEGHVYLAGLIAPVVEEALARGAPGSKPAD